ncbi:hypothetical protein [Roseospira navarrensis]|uniref:Uncharacterized protein n=1 Tax=Roseospira navarrensis TaxID=140058 RepID=A0A7X1ZF12_9PROT|nr:hypothetical protein [Roseospira navarrensis]MQX36814.1 hypothetical protein [Roseospira navarrensis]
MGETAMRPRAAHIYSVALIAAFTLAGATHAAEEAGQDAADCDRWWVGEADTADCEPDPTVTVPLPEGDITVTLRGEPTEALAEAAETFFRACRQLAEHPEAISYVSATWTTLPFGPDLVDGALSLRGWTHAIRLRVDLRAMADWPHDLKMAFLDRDYLVAEGAWYIGDDAVIGHDRDDQTLCGWDEGAETLGHIRRHPDIRRLYVNQTDLFAALF